MKSEYSAALLQIQTSRFHNPWRKACGTFPMWYEHFANHTHEKMDFPWLMPAAAKRRVMHVLEAKLVYPALQ